jgi:hypothetical protein
MELREQRALDPGAGLVTRPKPVPKRFDHMVSRDSEIRTATFKYLEHALQHADDRAVRAIHAFGEPVQTIEVTEELVGAVNEMDNHFG